MAISSMAHNESFVGAEETELLIRTLERAFAVDGKQPARVEAVNVSDLTPEEIKELFGRE